MDEAEADTGGGTGGGETVVFSPVFNFYGGRRAARRPRRPGDHFAEFKKLYRQMSRGEAQAPARHKRRTTPVESTYTTKQGDV